MLPPAIIVGVRPLFVSAVTSAAFVTLLESESTSTAGLQDLQTPAMHCWPDPHTLPHVPQLFGSVDVLISQPSLCLLALQSVHPAAQAPVQIPAAHVRVGT